MSDDPGYLRFREGYRLHMRGGRVADAERAYREAIAAGHVAVWVYLGVLLNALPGREDDAKAALRAALDDEDPALSSHAAVSLGGMLDKLDDDMAGARELYAFAAEHGTGRVWEGATVNLAFIRATEGDREGAIAGYQSFIARRYELWDVEIARDGGRGFAACVVSLVMRPRSRRRSAVSLSTLRRRLGAGAR